MVPAVDPYLQHVLNTSAIPFNQVQACSASDEKINACAGILEILNRQGLSGDDPKLVMLHRGLSV